MNVSKKIIKKYKKVYMYQKVQKSICIKIFDQKVQKNMYQKVQKKYMY